MPIRAVTSLRTTFVISLALLYSCASGSCADRSGTYDYTNCDAFTFTLPTSQAPSGKGFLVLHVRSPFPLVSLKWRVTPESFKVDAKRCSSKALDTCEAAVDATIRLGTVNDKEKRISGNFVVDFGNGDHEQGEFTAKYHHKGHKAECL